MYISCPWRLSLSAFLDLTNLRHLLHMHLNFTKLPYSGGNSPGTLINSHNGQRRMLYFCTGIFDCIAATLRDFFFTSLVIGGLSRPGRYPRLGDCLKLLRLSPIAEDVEFSNANGILPAIMIQYSFRDCGLNCRHRLEPPSLRSISTSPFTHPTFR